ncbi:MAG: DUF4011 domain-containing protein [Candidatus Coproplasma sp.]
MAANRKTKQQFEGIELDGELLNAVSYATYFNRFPLFTTFRVYNNGEENIENVIISISCKDGLILSSEVSIALLPAQSSTEVKTPSLLNPKFLADLQQATPCTVSVAVTCGKVQICALDASVLALPMDSWSGTSGNAEMLAAHVRPKLSDCQKILAEAGLQLKTWGYSQEWSGYAGNDRNAVRSALASIYSAIRNLNIERGEESDLTQTVTVGNVAEIVEERLATPVAMACFACSCLEAAKLNPVIILGKNKIGVGVWLYESCFTTPLQDDISVIERYVADGVNNLAFIDVDDLFAHKNASFTTSASHFSVALSGNKFDACLDIKRCRIGGIFAMPIKVKSGSTYEILGDTQFAYDAKPEQIIDADKLALERRATKDMNWERRLLDLSLKNNLLSFRFRRDSIHLISSDLAYFLSKTEGKDKLYVQPNNQKIEGALYFGGGSKLNNLTELIGIELAQGITRSYAGAERLQEVAASLIRKAKSSQEEVGANTLYLAMGFLKWKHDDDSEFKYAPLVLLPVNLKKTKTSGIAIELSEEYEVNTTLLEFLKQEFGIDIRGLDGQKLSPTEILAVFRAKTVNMKGWLVHEDIYVAQFTFARYAMWADVKKNMSVYKNNSLISSLLTNSNKLGENKLRGAVEDEGDPTEILTPLPCDSSQYSAIAESVKGTTFVLHGPPGTGKSQTITNMIANAVHSGKRVLFVAEKQAALQVVKKRLTEIGIADFCLELHSGKAADKAEIIRGIENTLALKDEFTDEKFISDAQKIEEDRGILKQPLAALHKKRRLGVSVYEGILYYLQNKNAPELVNIESTFYDSLTAKKLADYEGMLLTAQAAAKECGGVYRSPFSGVNICECDEKVQSSVLCSAEVVLAELRHLKSYLGLFTDTFNQKISAFTTKKLEIIIEIATSLKEDKLNSFFSCDEGDFYVFYNANLRYDAEVRNWYTRFKTLPELGKLADDVEKELDNWGDNYRSSKTLLAVLKRINRCGRTPVPQSEEVEWIKRACEIEMSRRKILQYTNLSSSFVGLGGGINDKKREEFMRPIYTLHENCASVFMDYNADAFNSVCSRASDGYLKPLLTGFITAAVAFVKACDHFVKVIKSDKSLVGDEDVFAYYNAKCTALIDNIDMLPAWCMYKATAKKLNASGLTFITDAMESGQISGEKILSAFRKNVYRNFIQTNIPADEHLSQFSATVLDETAKNFSQVLEEFTALTRQKIRHDLIARLPSAETEGPLALELMAFNRQVKGNMRGLNLRDLFAEIPELLKVVAPCMLMSPYTVSQYLPADPSLFDIVIFDEASQLPTCEAVPSLARAKSAIIVGDPKQMPPTSFFMNVETDEDNLEAEDLDSVLDDCLALGVPEKHLNWHYRSKHESLIAFSNIMYYSSRLCTFPSPDALDSKVSLRYVANGVYERGASKCNRLEAEELIEEVVRRLRDEKLRRSSIGIVTFSTPQQVYIEKLLNKKISDLGLEEAAFEREEPLFVKNLENVQGDERDVILFSVCYGPDAQGKISLNFGPLNQLGGWRRLNVAVSRAREEMVVFSSMRYSMIDLSRTTSRGVAGLKAFLEFAEKGRTNIAAPSDEIIINKNSIGKYVAEELAAYGYECRCDVGVSDFKVDVGVIDPANKHNFILAILCDGTCSFSIKDRSVMQVQTLKRNNWNVIRLYSINFFNNPKREIKKIKEYLDKLTSSSKVTANAFKRPYRYAKLEVKNVEPAYILSGDNDAELIKAVKTVVLAEEPISEPFLIERTLSYYGITKYGTKLEGKLKNVIAACGFSSADISGVKYYFKNDKYSSFDRYRVEEGTPVRTSDCDFTPYDVISLYKAVLLDKVSVYADELISMAVKQLKIPRVTEKNTSFFNECIDEGVRRGLFIRSISDRISLA